MVCVCVQYGVVVEDICGRGSQGDRRCREQWLLICVFHCKIQHLKIFKEKNVSVASSEFNSVGKGWVSRSQGEPQGSEKWNELFHGSGKKVTHRSGEICSATYLHKIQPVIVPQKLPLLLVLTIKLGLTLYNLLYKAFFFFIRRLQNAFCIYFLNKFFSAFFTMNATLFSFWSLLFAFCGPFSSQCQRNKTHSCSNTAKKMYLGSCQSSANIWHGHLHFLDAVLGSCSFWNIIM